MHCSAVWGAYEETAVDFRILDRFVAWKDLPQACSLLYQEASQDTRNEQVIIVSYSSKHSQHISLTLADTIHLKDLLSMRRISTFCTELIQHGYEHSAEAYARLTVSLEWLLAEQFGAILSAPPLQYEQRKQQLRSAFFQSADAYADALEQLLNELFAYNDQQREDRLDMLIKEIDNYILTHLQHSITLAGISESFHYNSSYLSHVYKQKTGEGLSEHVARIRVEHACQYLTSTALNMQQIAELCGFDSAKYFGVTFKRVIGMTPSAWREQHSSENKSIG